MFKRNMIAKSVPKFVLRRTQENMDEYFMDLYDAFKEAVREYICTHRCSAELRNAWYFSDFRKYIPSAYIPEKRYSA